MANKPLRFQNWASMRMNQSFNWSHTNFFELASFLPIFTSVVFGIETVFNLQKIIQGMKKWEQVVEDGPVKSGSLRAKLG